LHFGGKNLRNSASIRVRYKTLIGNHIWRIKWQNIQILSEISEIPFGTI